MPDEALSVTRAPSRRHGLGHALMVVTALLVAGCSIPTRDPTIRHTIDIDGTAYEVQNVLRLSGDASWAARLDVPADGASVAVVLDAPLRGGAEGAAFLAVLDETRIMVQGNLFHCEIAPLVDQLQEEGDSAEQVHFAAVHDLDEGSYTVLVVWMGVTSNGTARVALSADPPFTEFGQSEGAIGFQPSTMGDTIPLVGAGAFDRQLAGPTLFWADFFVSQAGSADLTVTADGQRHSGHVDPGPLPVIKSFAGIWNATDFSVTYQEVGTDPEAGLYGALFALPYGVPIRGWLEAQRNWCVPG